MAKEKATPITASPPNGVTKEPVYDASEIAANSKRLFGYGVDIATAALEYNGIQHCTINEAKRIIREFAERKA